MSLAWGSLTVYTFALPTDAYPWPSRSSPLGPMSNPQPVNTGMATPQILIFVPSAKVMVAWFSMSSVIVVIRRFKEGNNWIELHEADIKNLTELMEYLDVRGWTWSKFIDFMTPPAPPPPPPPPVIELTGDVAVHLMGSYNLDGERKVNDFPLYTMASQNVAGEGEEPRVGIAYLYCSGGSAEADARWVR